MHKYFNLLKDNFAYLSLGIMLFVVILLLTSTNTNTFAMTLVFVLIALYSLLFVKYRNLEQTILNQNIFNPTDNLSNAHTPINTSYATVDESFKIIDFNENFLNELEFKGKTILGKSLFKLLSTKNDDILKSMNKYGCFEGVIESSKNDKTRFYSLIIQPSSNKGTKEYSISYNNVTNSMKKSEGELKEKFLIDSFTGLSTKSKLIYDLEQIKDTHFNTKTLIYINIETFDEINEYFGIDAGNKILSHVANWLNNELPSKKAKLYKLDIGSFAILTTKTLSISDLNDYLKKISQDIEKENFYFNTTALNISITLGAAHCKTDMVKYAYLALKEAQNLKKSYKIYDKNSQHEEQFIKNIKMNQVIKDAIIENRVIPFFQPIYNLKTNEVEKFESLIRIQNRNEGYLKPIDFLDTAKKSKLYLELSLAMIKSSFIKLQISQFPITINISVNDILDKKVSSFIFRKLNSTNLGHLITFEILESEQIDNYIKVVNFIKKVKLFGCKVAIDDFGSGYSNFEQLLKLDVDYIKIDSSLIRDINTNKNNEIMTKSIISLARDMGIKTIAEFVSSQEILDKVRLLGVDYAQGYHIGRPTHQLGVN